ncbi:hypothetical protein [Roseococcus sp.]|uniref:hypothetical protein n=1 Tax=Roseococcus sp. TaxID=2109646 RepID=UPI003BA9D239
MTPALRRNRKASNEDILRYNAIGMSLTSIGEKLNCHATSVTLRLKSLNEAPADTRRGFMEDVLSQIDPDMVEELANIVMSDASGRPKPIKTYIRELLIKDVLCRRIRGIPLVEESAINDNAPNMPPVEPARAVGE